ncbi:hypothetical protein EDB87DRAFT_1578183 [Lactarius vividus]|nr:hypothetical protein EDB87DRAFT_1578183 [Lactarius vividus]
MTLHRGLFPAQNLLGSALRMLEPNETVMVPREDGRGQNMPTMFDQSVPSAWPHKRGEPNGPFLVVWVDHTKTALDHIHRITLQEGCKTPSVPVYCNTTLGGVTTPEQIYRDNLDRPWDRLSALRNSYDPDNVMGRTGGFRIPFRFCPPTINGKVDEHSRIMNTEE